MQVLTFLGGPTPIANAPPAAMLPFGREHGTVQLRWVDFWLHCFVRDGRCRPRNVAVFVGALQPSATFSHGLATCGTLVENITVSCLKSKELIAALKESPLVEVSQSHQFLVQVVG